MTFPPGFTWGASTSAYQIEGAAGADGKGPSVWDTFSHAAGNTRGGDTGDIACDSYHRYPEDADLMAALGLTAYRFSISWPRVLPDGRGPVNQAGLDYYRALTDTLGERGIAAVPTLFHWDLPQALQEAGGWASRDVAYRFADYAAVAGAALGDRVAKWITLNEPRVHAHLGYRTGGHAPGLRDPAAAAAATHHLLLGHGLAATALRAAAPAAAAVAPGAARPGAAEIGIALDLHPVRVTGDDPAVEHARSIIDAEQNGIFLDPLLHGTYPDRASADMLPPAALVKDGDMATISAPLDFLGINYYAPVHLRAGDPDRPLRGESPASASVPLAGAVEFRPDGMERTPMGWLVDPEGLYELLLRLAKDAPGLPLHITENGRANDDYVTPEGVVNDTERVRYLHGHLTAAARALRDGVNLAGYFVWSLLDNFEWAWGYQKRFGLVYVDFGSQLRIPKASAGFYANVIRTRGVPPLP